MGRGGDGGGGGGRRRKVSFNPFSIFCHFRLKKKKKILPAPYSVFVHSFISFSRLLNKGRIRISVQNIAAHTHAKKKKERKKVRDQARLDTGIFDEYFNYDLIRHHQLKTSHCRSLFFVPSIFCLFVCFLLISTSFEGLSAMIGYTRERPHEHILNRWAATHAERVVDGGRVCVGGGGR